MRAASWIMLLSAVAATPAQADKWAALTDPVEAGEIVLRDVCLPFILDQKPVETLASQEELVATPPQAAGARADARAWRLGSIRHVYAVAWADGSCSTYVNTGPVDDLRRMAERVILARPEGFARGRSGPADNGRVERTVYCAMVGETRLSVSITTPVGKPPRGTRALSSTAYRATGPSALCDANS